MISFRIIQSFFTFSILMTSSLFSSYHTYDALGRLTGTIHDNGGIVNRTYDPEGNMETISLFKDTDGDGLPDTWEIKYFDDPTAGDPNALGDDGDNITNLVEFGMGLDPDAADGDIAAVAIVSEASVDYLEIEYIRSKSGVNLTYQVEYTEDGVNWTSGPSFVKRVSKTPVPGNPSLEIIRERARISLEDAPNPPADLRLTILNGRQTLMIFTR